VIPGGRVTITGIPFDNSQKLPLKIEIEFIKKLKVKLLTKLLNKINHQ